MKNILKTILYSLLAVVLATTAVKAVSILLPQQGGTGTGTVFTSGSIPVAGTNGVYSQFNPAFTYTTGNFHVGTAVGTTNATVGGVGAELGCNDNSNGGCNFIISNSNAGGNAFGDIFFQNDQTVGNPNNFAVINLNSSGYNYAGYGTGIQIPNQLAMYNTIGPTTFGAVNATPANAYINYLIGGTNLGNEVMRLNATGLGIATTAPTHSLTLGSTGTGIAAYNTSDQTVNYERIHQYWTGNTYTFATEKGGTGTARNFNFTGGNVGIGATAPVAKLQVGVNANSSLGTNVLFQDINHTLASDAYNTLILSSDTAAIDKGGNIGLGGSYTGTNPTIFGSIAGRKENVTAGNYAGYLALATRAAGSGSPVEAMRINSTGQVGIGTIAPSGLLSIGGNQTASAWGTAGINFQTAAATYTDSSTAASTTVGNNMVNSFGIPTLAATNATVTDTNAATVYIAGAPVAGTNTTITTPYALDVASGLTNLQATQVNGTLATNIIQSISGAPAAQINLSVTGTLISHNVADANVALTVTQTNAAATGAIQAWAFNGGTVANVDTTGFFGATGIKYFGGGNNAAITLASTGTSVSRNIADANPAFVVNQANASSTGVIQQWQFAGSQVGAVDSTGKFYGAEFGNLTTLNNARVQTAATGTTISRNIADANTALTVNQVNASSTGKIFDAQFGGVSQFSVDTAGTTKIGGGQVIITGSNGNISSAGQISASSNILATSGFLGTTGAFSNANFLAIGGSSISSSTSTASLLFGGASSVQFRSIFNGSTSSGVGTNLSAANVIYGSTPFTVAASGTTGNLSNAVFNPIGTVTNGSSITVSETSTVLINGAGTGATVASNNYALKVASGVSKFGGVVRINGYTVATLPAGVQGDTAYVTDALTPAFGGILTGGGSVVTKAFYNGTNWIAE